MKFAVIHICLGWRYCFNCQKSHPDIENGAMVEL